MSYANDQGRLGKIVHWRQTGAARGDDLACLSKKRNRRREVGQKG